ncbi:natural product biosynthesis luciferase-like monooxygenase protein [Novosphingobium sp. PhB165]|uniref:MupA/Atu3671 family FMN-dependent luciferase-like monooxygenase n=1 Tax=Novosphingobium sp. PhB165 TaxID=2485105 RepID=UPI001045B56C|nr:MupA/Atu3671 family FMN-dependent luciferase-like monooxygenase [Novosphingobium sp. PhB165]TCM20816.1 natural product biosynthesis luciferase-like monooxygenase protein [Novosphingobium sp. PhB165]
MGGTTDPNTDPFVELAGLDFDGKRGGAARTILVGNETLLAQCGELLRERGHQIVAVVATPLSPAADWARRGGLPLFGRQQDLLSAGIGPIDWLFSISNLSVLSEDVLGLASRGAVNFHDGPLPARAGLNTPVWALLDDAGEHGVTWHLMTREIDRGAVLAAETFEIAPGETALSLNTRCFEAGLRCFETMVADLDRAVASAVPQTQAPLRMFGRADRPAAAATIDWSCPAAEIARLVGALDYGAYANPMGTPKALLGEHLFLVRQITVLDDWSGAEPGTVLHWGASPVVATADRDIRIERMATLDGEPLESLDIGNATVFSALSAERCASLEMLDAAAGRFEAWWRRRLQLRESLQLPSFRPPSEEGGPVWTVIDRPLAPGCGGMATMALMVACLARMADRDSVEIGYGDEVGRSRLEDVAAWFANEAPLKVAVDFTAPVAALTERLQREIADLHRHVAISRDLVARSPELRSGSGFAHPVSVQLVDRLEDARPREGSVLSLAICAPEGTWRWTFDATRFLPDEADDLWNAFEAMQAAAEAAPELSVGKLPLLTAAERSRVLQDWNATETALPPGETWHQRFVEQAALTPDRLAVTSCGTSLTYGELDALSNRIAHSLAARGVGPEVLVGLHLSRSVEMLACLIAVHKAGGAYVPLDPSYPRDRLAHMVADSGMRLILSEAALAGDLSPGHAQVLLVEDLRPALATLSSDPIEGGETGGNLAYMIYTSGSTGLPKGVMVEHRNLLNFFAGMDAKLEPEGTWLAVTSLSFDISVLELLWPLMHGYHVIIANEREVRGDVRSGGHGSVQAAVPTRPVGFSLFYFASSRAGDAAEQYRLLLEGARFADTHGFEAVWTPERHFHAFGGPYPNPSVAAAAIAASTTRVQIRAGSVVGTLHHPLRIAEEWALVDNISGGRVGIAFASGWQPDDFVFNPAAFADKAGTLRRCMDDVRGLWRGEARSYPGPLGHDVEIRTYPRPLQPELPCWITSAGNVDTFIQAGRVGANVLTHLLGQSIEDVAVKLAAYREAWREAGHPGEGRTTLMLHTFLGEDEASVRAIVREPLLDYLRTATNLLHQYAWSFPAFRRPNGEVEQVSLEGLTAEETDALLEHAFERYFETSGLFGTPEDNLDLIARLSEIGVDEVGCLIDFGVDTETVIRHLPTLDRLRDRVQNPAPAPAFEADSPLHELMARHGVTHLQCTPSLLQVLAGDPEARPRLAALRRLMVGGEAFPPQLAQDMAGLVHGKVMNMYGPTETTVWSAVHVLEPGEVAPPLGRPLANQQVYILDRRLEPVRPGSPGELVIGGAGVVRGYHARPDLTAERFVAHPFLAGERAYRTGDLARQRADGTLEFLGRLDHQVKIRGYRIELGEIESALTAHPNVAEAVVVALREGATTRLVGYVSPRGVPVQVDALREHLRIGLPEFMVPGTLVVLDALPRTPNGKIDRKALPDPGTVTTAAATEHAETAETAPANEIEAQIKAIWCDLLKIPHVGRGENFFDIGGHSLLAIQAHRRLAAIAPRPLALTDVFRFPTIAALGAHLTADESDAPAMREVNERALARRNAFMRRGAARAGTRVGSPIGSGV